MKTVKVKEMIFRDKAKIILLQLIKISENLPVWGNPSPVCTGVFIDSVAVFVESRYCIKRDFSP